MKNCKFTKRAAMRALFLALICTAALSEAADYTECKLYKVGPITPAFKEVLPKIVEMGCDLFGSGTDNTMNILVSPDQKKEFESLMSNADINTEVLVDDFAKVLEREKRSVPSNSSIFEFDHFPRYAEIVSAMYDMAAKSKYARMIKIGKSFEGRQILGIRLQSSFDKPVIFVDGGMHAREWAAPITALYLIKRIIELEEVFANRATIYIIPCVNPDGYEYTHDEERLWRKSRSIRENTTCVGVDLNRNFDSYWGVYGVNMNPCSSTYPGTKAFTEPEAIAIAHAINKIKPVMYLTLHSYGPLLLYPWGFTNALPENWMELERLAYNATQALKRVNGQQYVIGSSTNILYRASGGSDDWAMEKANVSLVYTMELPHYGTGFVVPVEKIIPMGEETFAAFQVFARYVCFKGHNSNCY